MTDLPNKADFASVRDWVFDLDNTLYPPHMRLFDQIEVRMTDWVMRALQVDRARADHLRAYYWATYGTTLAGLMREHDVLLMPEPVYYGGTTDRSVGSEDIASGVRADGRQADALATRADCGDRIVEIAKPGDRVIVMGARDDTLSTFAAELLGRLG